MPDRMFQNFGQTPHHQKIIRIWVATGLLLLSFYLAIDSLIDDSPTMDEQNHIARGLVFLRTGDPRLSLEHPPLINSLSALPLLTMPDLRLPTDHPSWERREGWYEFADLFMWQYNHDVEKIVFLSRLPIVMLWLFLGLMGYWFARTMWGMNSALLALGLFLFEPNLLAHGRYATTDLGGTLLSFIATFCVWQVWQVSDRWDWGRWLLLVVAMGLSFGSKLSTLGFVPIWIILAWLPLYPSAGFGQWRQFLRGGLVRTIQLITAGFISIVVVWLIFGFEWGAFSFLSPALERLNSFAGPMPTFWAGLEQIALLSGSGRSQAFLLGRFSDDGFPLYFPVAFLMKTPTVLILLLIAATILLLRNQHTRRRAVFLLSTALAFYVLSTFSALNIGYRHVLPALPYLLVLSSGILARQLAADGGKSLRPITGRWSRWAATIGLGLLILGAVRIHPHYLSYFNLIAGGAENGYRVLIDSNVDWGQDLLRLKDWMEKENVARVKLGWFGSADPDYYGIDHDPLPGIGRDDFFRRWWEVPFNTDQPEPGVYAISATSLWEIPLRLEEKTVYAWFREREPDDRVGYSILIYDVH